MADTWPYDWMVRSRLCSAQRDGEAGDEIEEAHDGQHQEHAGARRPDQQELDEVGGEHQRRKGMIDRTRHAAARGLHHFNEQGHDPQEDQQLTSREGERRPGGKRGAKHDGRERHRGVTAEQHHSIIRQ